MTRTKYKPRLIKSPLDLPETKKGKMAIRHRIIKGGETVTIIGGRQALLRGIPSVEVKLEVPLRIHELVETGKGLWMTDLPEELNQIEEMVHRIKPQGSVLIGGLGLGILATRVAQLPGVTDVTVIERSADVIRLITTTGRTRPDCRVQRADILKFLQTTKEEFDYYLLDTWQGTSESTWWGEVMPLRRAITNRWGIGKEIHCWAEDIMWGQIYRSLQLQGTIGNPMWYYSYLPCPMSPYDAEAFLDMVGSAWWEGKFGEGVDRYINETTAKRKQA